MQEKTSGAAPLIISALKKHSKNGKIRYGVMKRQQDACDIINTAVKEKEMTK